MDDDGFDDHEVLLFNLVYCSRAARAFEPAELEQLVLAAQKRNASESLTGWLVYSHGIFFQWLEGIHANVSRVMASIQLDPRHHTIIILTQSEEHRSRVFSGWDMELVSSDDIRAVLFDAIDASTNTKIIAAMKKLLMELDARISSAT